MSEPIRVLMITRERESDRKYGLGKSLIPVMIALERQGIECGYLNQENAGSRGWKFLRKVHAVLKRPLGAIFKGTQVESLLWGLFERVNVGRLATKVAARDGWTHLHCHDPLIGFGVLIFRPFSDAKFFWGVTEHGFGSYTQALHEDGARLGGHVMRWLRQMEARILSKADWVVFPTRSARAQAVRDLSLPAPLKNWYVIPHARPEIRVYPRSEARARLSLPANGLVVLAVGRLVPLKGFDLLICAFSRALSSDARLIILGEGDQTPYRDLAKSLGVSERVQITVSDDVGLFYCAADIYVSTSITESFGMANLEAMVAGLAGVYSAVGGVIEVVANSGILIPPGDLPTLESSLRRLVADPGMRSQLGRVAQERGRAWVNAGAVASAYIGCYSGRAPNLNPVSSFEVDSSTGSVGTSTDASSVFKGPSVILPRGDLSILVIAPHADDETLGCGGTIRLLRDAGAVVCVCVLTDGRLGDPCGYLGEREVVEVRKEEAMQAAAHLGVNDIVFLGFEDGALAAEPALEGALAKLIKSRRPDWLFIPSLVDDHSDHVAASGAALNAAKTTGNPMKVFMYEVWTPLPVNRIIDISLVAQCKRNALSCYELPLKYVNYSDAVDGLMRYRGLTLPGGRGFAEAFLELTAERGEMLADSLRRIQVVRQPVL